MAGQQLEPVESLLTKRLGEFSHSYDERDVSLYALGLGVHDLKYVYECAADFAPLPTFAVVPAFPATYSMPLQFYLPNFDRARALHGEQFVELLAPLPPAASVVTSSQLVDVQDKGSGATVVLRTTTSDAQTGHRLAVNEFTTFVVGSGGFKGVERPLPRSPAATAAHNPPARPPDAVKQVATGVHQAQLYRLSGDLNPLHIDPSVSKRAGFDAPILHGLATMGMSVRQVLHAFGGDDPGSISSIKVRFRNPVVPGDVLLVEMWQTSPTTVVFQTRGRGGAPAISNAAVEFRAGKLVPQRPSSSSSSSSRSRL